jgi:hypothetical protein
VIDTNVCGYTGDEGDEFSSSSGSNSNVELGLVPWWGQCPCEECGGVVEAEYGLRVFDIIIGQELVEFVELLGLG